MKKNNLLLTITLCLLLSSCGMQKFTIGDTSGETILQDKRKEIHLFNSIPIKKRERNYSFPISGDAKGYEITTGRNLFDYLITVVTGGIINMRTVRFRSTK